MTEQPAAMAAGDFAHGLVDREVPRREAGDRPDRLLHDELMDAVGARRNDAAIGAAALLGEPVDDVAAGDGLPLRLDEGLALLERHDPADIVGAAAQNIRRLAHELVAVMRRDLAPGGEALGRRGQRAVEIGAVGMRQRADRLAGRGIENGLALALGALAPGAVDVERDLGIGLGHGRPPLIRPALAGTRHMR